MCLVPDPKGSDLQSLLRAEYASALVAIELPKPGALPPVRRARLWDLDDKLHCPIIGTCISIEELQRFARRFQFAGPTDDDFTVHVEAVGLARKRNPVSEALQRHLEKKFHLVVERFAKLKSDAELRQQWIECCARGEVAGPLWAVCTHRAVSAETRQRAYTDVHMLSHQVGAGQAADARRLAHLEGENAELKRSHSRELALLRQQLADVSAGLARREGALEQAAVFQKRLQRFESGQAYIEMGQRLLALQTSHEALLGTSRQLQDMERQLKESREESRRLLAERDAAVEEREAMAHVLQLREAPVCGNTGSEDCAGCSEALTARCVLYVGGRASLLAQYRQLAERLGITLIHHDGGQEESLSRLPELIRGADAVVCPTDRISHNAYYHVKAHCKRVGKPCLFYRGGGVSGFAVAMARVSRGEFSVAGSEAG
jgi:hypothetical protein